MLNFQTQMVEENRTIRASMDGAQVGFIELARLSENTFDMTHTRVFSEFEGKGYGKQLIKAAVEWARMEGVKLTASCPYARVVLDRTREWHDVKL